jgi:hypothetical protein
MFATCVVYDLRNSGFGVLVIWGKIGDAGDFDDALKMQGRRGMC